MHRYSYLLLIVLAALLLPSCIVPPGGGDDDDDAADDDDDDNDANDDDDSAVGPPTFTAVWTDVISINCSCHGSGAGGWAHNNNQSDAYEILVGISSGEAPDLNRIEPFDTDASYLVHKLDGSQDSVGGSGARMPRNSPQLPQVERALIRDWINAGALNN
jgi:hypothetical protein